MPHRVLTFCLVAGSLLPAAEPIVIEQIVAKVNGEIITRSELARMKKAMIEDMKARGAKPEELEAAMKEREKDFLREKIDTMLLVQKGRDLSINVDPDVTKQMAAIQKASKIVDADKFQSYVREGTGMAYEDYKAEMKNNLLTRRVIGQEVSSKIVIPKAEIRKYYDEHKDEFQREERVFLREIFLTIEGKSEAEKAAVEKKAKDLVARARKGEKFGELARDNSDSESARNEGELPPSKKGELRKELEEKVWAAPRNTVLDPIAFPNGWLILRVDEHHQAGLADYEEVEGEVTNKLFEPRMQPAVREYLTKLRAEAFLEIREGYADSAAAAGKSTRWSDAAVLKPETVTRAEVANQTRRKRLLFVPVPGTSTGNVSTSKS
ncbi:MAG TPA: peptidyl-prolyl cis-trans isomerase [Bryobacteraceae bacterium]|nr:peptidyl-prolyl cis-trans isomerase [Bryobacteraceae bacterium]